MNAAQHRCTTSKLDVSRMNFFFFIAASEENSDSIFDDSRTTRAPADRYYWKPNENSVGG